MRKKLMMKLSNVQRVSYAVGRRSVAHGGNVERLQTVGTRGGL
jgi:hypothetical protein